MSLLEDLNVYNIAELISLFSFQFSRISFLLHFSYIYSSSFCLISPSYFIYPLFRSILFSSFHISSFGTFLVWTLPFEHLVSSYLTLTDCTTPRRSLSSFSNLIFLFFVSFTILSSTLLSVFACLTFLV